MIYMLCQDMGKVSDTIKPIVENCLFSIGQFVLVYDEKNNTYKKLSENECFKLLTIENEEE